MNELEEKYQILKTKKEKEGLNNMEAAILKGIEDKLKSDYILKEEI